MAILTPNPYATRQTIALTSNEIWQVSGGAIRVQTTAPTSASDGVVLQSGMSTHQFSSGTSVTVWLDGSIGATIVRMPV